MKNDVFFKLPGRSIFPIQKSNTLSYKIGEWIPIDATMMSPGDEIQQDFTQITRFAPMLTPVMGRFRGRVVSAFIPFRLLNIDYEDINIAKYPNGAEFPTINLKNALPVANVGSLLDYLRYPVYASLFTDVVNGLNETTVYSYYNEAELPGASWDTIFNPSEISEMVLDTSSLRGTYNGLNFDGIWPLHRWLIDQYGYYSSLDEYIELYDLGTIQSIYNRYYNYVLEHVSSQVVTNDDPYPDFLLRAYWRFIGDWCVNSNITDPDSLLAESLPDGSNFPLTEKYLKPAKALYSDDLFTASMPRAQVGNAVQIPVDGTIQDLANATALQRVLIRAMYTGKRYIDYVKSFFGVNSSDARLQRCEIIGSNDFRINISDIAQTSQSDVDSVLGGYSGRAISYDGKTPHLHYKCEEHGIIMSFVVIKPMTSYIDGISPLLTITNTKELLIPDMQAVGNEPIPASLITGKFNDKAINFGFARPYWQYIDDFSEVHGEFRTTMQEWHLGRRFDDTPALNEEFISISEADDINRIFAIQANENVYSQFVFDKAISRPLSRTIDFKL